MHRFAPVALLSLAFSLGCDISAKPFAGTIIEMTISGATALPPGQHLELWARNQYDDTVRVSGIFDTTVNNKTTRLFPFGFTVRPLITFDDPCMIVTDPTSKHVGALLTKAEAYDDADVAGVHQTPEEQAQQVRTRIAQITPSSDCDGSPDSTNPALVGYHCGHQGTAVLYGAIAWELVDANGAATSTFIEPPVTCQTHGNVSGCIDYNATPAERLAACQSYWGQSPLAYTPNPLQITGPLHGQLYGEFTYISLQAPGIFDSIRIDSDVALKGIQELWMTVESKDSIDVLNRGPIYLDGTPGEGGREIVHIDLTPPFGSTATVSGSAALNVGLDQDPVYF
jgi:hypothetical protein